MQSLLTSWMVHKVNFKRILNFFKLKLFLLPSLFSQPNILTISQERIVGCVLFPTVFSRLQKASSKI